MPSHTLRDSVAAGGGSERDSDAGGHAAGAGQPGARAAVARARIPSAVGAESALRSYCALDLSEAGHRTWHEGSRAHRRNNHFAPSAKIRSIISAPEVTTGRSSWR